MGFDKLETAARVRDIIKQGSRQVVSEQVPRPLIGRMVTVNLRKLQGTVWFPGDDQPILVQLMSNAIPGDWHYRYGAIDTNEDTMSIAGYGSIVICQRLNGVIYVIYVLSGGQMNYELQAVGLGIVMQKTFDDTDLSGATVAVDIAGDPHESFFAVELDAGVGVGEAVEFGPFVKLEDGRTRFGHIEINISSFDWAKSYKFVLNPHELTQEADVTNTVYPWLRIIPTHEAAQAGGANDIELDICYRPSEDEFRNDIWFRIVNAGYSISVVSAKISIKSTMFNKARMLSNTEALVHRVVEQPSEPWGYLGYYRSDHVFDNVHDGDHADNFGRSVTTGWGVSDRGYSYGYLPSSSAFRVNGQDGIIEVAANNTTYVAYNTDSNLIRDFYFQAAPEENVLTQDVWGGIAIDVNTGSGDMLMVGLAWKTTGDVYAFIRRKNSGTITLVGSEVDTNLSYLNNDPSYYVNVHVRYERDANSNARILKIKTWFIDEPEPRPWLIEQTVASGSSPAVSVNAGMFAHAVTGNTNTKPYGVHFREYKLTGDHFTPEDSGGFSNVSFPWHTGPWRSGALRTAEALQKTWTYDGRFDWDGTYLKIVGKVHFDGIGMNRNGLKSGYAYLEMVNNTSAASAANRFIPVMPFDDEDETSGFREWDLDQGIQLYEGESLWCGIPPGSDQTNLIRNLFIVNGGYHSAWNSESTAQYYSLPEWAVMIASRAQSGATPEVRLGNGEMLDSWKNIPLSNGWTNRGGAYPPLQYRRINSYSILVRGHLSSGTTTGGTTIATLPSGVRPKYDEEALASNAGNDIVANSNGTIVIWAGTAGFYKITGVIPLN